MGCDIHCFIEKKTDEKYNVWQQVKIYNVNEWSYGLDVVNPYDGRSYDLFSILAGVRGEYEPLVSPRGLPENLSQDVEKEKIWWNEDYHTPTWYDLNELLLFKKMYAEKEEYESFIYFVDKIEMYLDFAKEWIYGDVAPGRYRVIMWFDS